MLRSEKSSCKKYTVPRDATYANKTLELRVQERFPAPLSSENPRSRPSAVPPEQPSSNTTVCPLNSSTDGLFISVSVSLALTQGLPTADIR